MFYSRDDLVTSGYPRLIEVEGLLCSCFIFFYLLFFKNCLHQKCDHELKSILSVFIWIFLLMSFFALFKPYYQIIYRTSCLIPFFVFLSIVLFLTSYKNDELKKKMVDFLFLFFYIVITLSALVVVLSVFIDLGGKYIDTYEGDNTLRLCGWGQDVSYQSCYCLWGICFGLYYMEKKGTGIAGRIINISAIMLNICATLLTGAKTGYFVLLFLCFLNIRKIWKTLLLMGIVLLIYLSCFENTLWDSIINLFVARTTTTGMSLRNEVWSDDMSIFLSSPIWGVNSYEEAAKGLGIHLLAHSQSSYFELLFWGGIPLLVFEIIFYIKSWKMILLKKNDISKDASSFFLVFLFFSMTEILFFSVQCYYSFLVILALMLTYPSTEASTPEEKTL